MRAILFLEILIILYIIGVLQIHCYTSYWWSKNYFSFLF